MRCTKQGREQEIRKPHLHKGGLRGGNTILAAAIYLQARESRVAMPVLELVPLAILQSSFC